MRSVEMSHIPTIDNVLMGSVPYKMYPTNSTVYMKAGLIGPLLSKWRFAGGPIVARWVLAKVRDQDDPRAGCTEF